MRMQSNRPDSDELRRPVSGGTGCSDPERRPHWQPIGRPRVADPHASRSCSRSRLALVALVAIGFVGAAPLALARDDSRWETRIDGELTMEYDDNVFGLNEPGRTRVKTRDAVDQANGRLNGMDSVGDFGLISQVEFHAIRESPLGRTRITPRVAYHQYIENSGLSFPEFGIQLKQSLGEASVLKLDFGSAIGVRRRNYLAGTIGTGEISDAERIYRSGRFDDWDVALTYERRLWRNKKKRRKHFAFAELEGEVGLRYGQRIYRNRSFRNRDRDVWRAGLKLDSDLGRWLDLGVSYRYTRVDAPGGMEIVILDEPDLGGDLNGDLDALDSNIRTVARIDRSRNQHRVGADLGLKLHERLRAWVSYDYASLDYLSNGPLDLSFRDRRDAINRFGGGFRWRFSKIFALTLEGLYSDRSVDRSASLDEDEDGQKERAVVRLTIGARF